MYSGKTWMLVDDNGGDGYKTIREACERFGNKNGLFISESLIYPENVKVLEKDNSITLVNTKKLFQHEKDIIEDNVCWGYKSNYSENEINNYLREAKKELKQLKAKIRKHPDIILTFDPRTERFFEADIIQNQKSKGIEYYIFVSKKSAVKTVKHERG